MSIYVSSNVIVDPLLSATLEWPVFLWDNLLDYNGIVASAEATDFPATNLWNPQTSSLWKADTADIVILEFTVDPQNPIDAIGFARHNFGTAQALITINGITADDGAVYQELIEFTPGDDTAILCVVDAEYYTTIQVIIESTNLTEPQCGCVGIGTLLRMSTGIPPGHYPVKDSLEVETLAGIAENGDFLGDIITSQVLKTSIDFKLLEGDWYRTNMRAFVQAHVPFWFGWAPLLYPTEMAYGKINGNPKPQINQSDGRMDITIPIIALAY